MLLTGSTPIFRLSCISSMYFLRLLQRLFLRKNVTETQSCFLHADEKDYAETGAELKQIIKNLYGGRALCIRAVDGGSTNAEESELTMLGNVYYDIERFGLSFVASPRHADMLFVTGPVTRNLERAVRSSYESAPHPCIVVAIGDGACTGGIWKDSYAVVGPVDAILPVHVRIPGDPPTPTDILRGILHALRATA